MVVWSGIQRSLEMARSDVLILLDCCSSGVANASEDNGVTELICACPFDFKANGVGQYSFTQALITELRLLRKKTACFSVDELYTSIYTRMQSYLEQGIVNERYPPPVHFVLTQDEPFVRSIQLFVQEPKGLVLFNAKKRKLCEAEDEKGSIESQKNRPIHLHVSLNTRFQGATIEPPHSSLAPPQNCSYFGKDAETNHYSAEPQAGLRNHVKDESEHNTDIPRALFGVCFREDVRGKDLSVALFKEWLRSIPAAVEEVRVEAGFKCFSTFLLITLPLSMCAFLPQHPAIYALRTVNSPIILPEEQQASHDLGIKDEGISNHSGTCGIGQEKAVSLTEPTENEIESRSNEYKHYMRDQDGGGFNQNILEYRITTMLML
jgi:hypothetical protein